MTYQKISVSPTDRKALLVRLVPRNCVPCATIPEMHWAGRGPTLWSDSAVRLLSFKLGILDNLRDEKQKNIIFGMILIYGLNWIYWIRSTEDVSWEYDLCWWRVLTYFNNQPSISRDSVRTPPPYCTKCITPSNSSIILQEGASLVIR